MYTDSRYSDLSCELPWNFIYKTSAEASKMIPDDLG